jgi:peroxiredoxin
MRIPRGAVGLFLAGLGLIVLGGAIGAYLLLGRQPDNALQPTDLSAVPAAVDYAAPSLALSDLSGVTHQLAEYRGQVVLVNLWATWCPPCQAEMPLFQSYFERHRAAGFTIVAVEDGEPESDVKAFVAKYELTFPVWLDPSHEATDHAFRAPGLPTSYVIDRTGQVRLTWVGAISEENLEKYVTPLIEER